MEWISWAGFVIFFGGMLALLIYSIVSTSSAIRKKAQPSLDTFFDDLFNMIVRRGPSSGRDQSYKEEREK